VFPKLLDLPNYLNNVERLGKGLLVPAAALRLDSQKNYQPELIYFDEGSKISFMPAAAVDSCNGVFVGSSVLQYGGFEVCKVPTGAFA